jgi:hypothetical protein
VGATPLYIVWGVAQTHWARAPHAHTVKIEIQRRGPNLGQGSPNTAAPPASSGLFGTRLTLTAESLRSLYICLAYGASSIVISLVYKALLRCACRWGVPSPFFRPAAPTNPPHSP